MEDIPSEDMKLLATDPRFAIALEIIGHGGVEGKETPTPFRQRSADMSSALNAVWQARRSPAHDNLVVADMTKRRRCWSLADGRPGHHLLRHGVSLVIALPLPSAKILGPTHTGAQNGRS